MPPEKRTELARTYGDRAVALLTAAVRKGFQDVARINKDPALDPLRARPDFQEVIAGLGRQGRSEGVSPRR